MADSAVSRGTTTPPCRTFHVKRSCDGRASWSRLRGPCRERVAHTSVAVAVASESTRDGGRCISRLRVGSRRTPSTERVSRRGDSPCADAGSGARPGKKEAEQAAATCPAEFTWWCNPRVAPARRRMGSVADGRLAPLGKRLALGVRTPRRRRTIPRARPCARGPGSLRRRSRAATLLACAGAQHLGHHLRAWDHGPGTDPCLGNRYYQIAWSNSRRV